MLFSNCVWDWGSEIRASTVSRTVAEASQDDSSPMHPLVIREHIQMCESPGTLVKSHYKESVIRHLSLYEEWSDNEAIKGKREDAKRWNCSGGHHLHNWGRLEVSCMDRDLLSLDLCRGESENVSQGCLSLHLSLHHSQRGTPLVWVSTF